MNPLSFISSICSAIGNVFAWATGRSALKNAPDMKAAQKAQDEANAKAKTNEAIAKKDTDEIRKELAD